MSKRFTFFALLITVLVFTTLCVAQDAQIRVHVAPEEAYTFLDGKAIGVGEHLFTTTPGTHTIAVYNYGFKPQVHEVTLQSGTNPSLQAYLEPAGENVSGPWGVIQIEGADNAAVLLNGKTPDFFVGNGDAMNNHIWWKQQLIVPPTTHEVTVMKGDQVLWNGTVTVQPNQRTIVYIKDNGRQEMKSWAEGTAMSSLPRFKAGTASQTVAVAPVSGKFLADPMQINCNDTVKLSWTTTETLHAYLSGDPALPEEEVPLIGEKSFQPKATTRYSFRSLGPGGVVHFAETVNVDPVVKASLTPSTEPVHFLKIGDKVMTQDSATLKWNVINADTINIEPLGPVAATGEQSFMPTPKQTTAGPVDETQDVLLTASNVCGGSDKAAATVHLVGAIQPVVTSVFFPTAWPKPAHADDGLLQSQQQELLKVVDAFKIYMEHTPDAKLLLVGNTDPRDSQPRNLKLSKRRAELVQAFLVTHGIPKDRIEMQWLGKKNVLDMATVQQLEAENPAAAVQPVNAKTTRLAYNRRVDVVLMPIAVESAKHFPHHAADSAVLMQRRPPTHRTVTKNQ